MLSYRKYPLFLTLLVLATTLHAQWTAEDSIWIEGVKSGKIKVELNPEVMNAIEEGRFLETDQPTRLKLLESPSRLPINKDFMLDAPKKIEDKRIDPATLPSAVLLLYAIPDSANRKSLVYVPPKKDYISMKIIPIGNNGFYISANTGDLNPLVKDGQSRGGAMASVSYMFSAEDLLRHIFWASERAKKRNRKYATAWKYY